MPDDVICTIHNFPEPKVSMNHALRRVDISLLAVERIVEDRRLWAFVETGWAALVASGHAAQDAVAYVDGDTALVARDGTGAPVGILIHRHTSRPARTFISFGYVRPDGRRMGVYSRLYARLVAEARVAGSAAIESEAYPDNEAILACALRQGRVVSRLILQAKL